LQKKLKADETADIRGLWEVIYITGTVAGKREGHVSPRIVIRITNETIDLPALTDNPNAPVKRLDGISYTLEPGRREAEERVKKAENKVEGAYKQLNWFRRKEDGNDRPRVPD
jgi:hypothetical protein